MVASSAIRKEVLERAERLVLEDGAAEVDNCGTAESVARLLEGRGVCVHRNAHPGKPSGHGARGEEPSQRVRHRSGATAPDPDETEQAIVATVEQRAREGGAHRSLVVVGDRAGGEDEVRLGEIASEPDGPALDVPTRAAAGKLVQKVLREISLREALDEPDLADPHRQLTRERSCEPLARRPNRHHQPDELVLRHQRHRQAAAPDAELRPEPREPEALRGARWNAVRSPAEGARLPLAR